MFYKNQSEAEFITEISNLSDRLIGILAPIILEERLEAAITHRWVDGPIKGGTTIFSELFRPGGEIGPFGTKIRVGLAVGLFGGETFTDLTLIEKIRNTFAHRLDVKQFDQQPICDHARNLKVMDRWSDDAPMPIVIGTTHKVYIGALTESDGSLRGRFLKSVFLLSDLLYHEAQVRRADPRTPQF